MRTVRDGFPTGRYRLLEVIGRGGMGVVWRALDTDLDRVVAVKELRLPEGVDDAERATFYARVEREARAAARLKHPGIVTVHERFTADGRPWIVMEYLEGGSLQDLLAERQRLPANAVAALGEKVLAALRAAHTAGVVHRDIKPANVLLEGDRVVLTDFGIATLEGDIALTRSGAILGTPAYMSAEQVRGQPATPESDLWSLGATLYAAVEGRVPFDGTGAGGIFVAIATEDPRPIVHAGPLIAVLDGLLVKDPARRMGAEEAQRRLAELGRDAGPLPTRVAAPLGAPVPAPDPVRVSLRYRYPALAVAVLVVLVVLVAGRLLWQGLGSGGTNADPTVTVTASPSPTEPPTSPTSATPTPADTSSADPMSGPAITQVFTRYMNGLALRDMGAMRAAACPRLRPSLGFLLNGYYVGRWTLPPYYIPPGVEQVSLDASYTRIDPGTAKSAGTVHGQWTIERDSAGRYWVCGFTGQ